MFRHPFAHRVTGDFTAVQVPQGGRTQPTLIDRKRGDVTTPDLIGHRHRDILVQRIRRDRQVVLRIRRGLDPALLLAALSRFSAQPPDPVQADSHATLLLMSPQALRPETFPNSPVDREHLRFQGEVPATCFRVTCACTTHGGRSSVRPALGTLAARGSLVAFVQSAPHLDAFAKYVANLLRRARSVPTSTSQRLARASSASISVSGFRCRSTTSFRCRPSSPPRPRFVSILI